MVIGTESENVVSSSNSNQGCCIYFCINNFGRMILLVNIIPNPTGQNFDDLNWA